jgi:S-adenosylmethionine synthetase
MPLALDLSHKLLEELAIIRKEGNEISYLRPDSKSQVTVEYKNGLPQRIDTIVISTQHDEFDEDNKMLNKIKFDIQNILIPRVLSKYPFFSKYFNDDIIYHINPTGKFVIGGPHGDTGLTGRKIIVDTYGGKGAHGGGAFSGKDPSKVDRSAAYATRNIAKNICAAGIAKEVLVQVSYAIGVSEPVGLFVNTFGTSSKNIRDSQISDYILNNIDITPYGIENRLKLRNPIYSETSIYGHMGRKFAEKSKNFTDKNLREISTNLELFTWENLDLTDQLKVNFS